MTGNRRTGIAGRLILSSILSFGQTAVAMAWLQATGPIAWIFAFCGVVELLFFLRLLLLELGLAKRAGTRTLVDRLTKIGLWSLFLFGAGAIIIGLDITPASAYLAWFQLVQEGAGGGTLAYMFAVKFAFFGALFGGFFMVGGGLAVLLNLAAVDLLLVAVLLGKPGMAAIGVVLFLVSLARRVMLRNPRLTRRAVLALVQVSVIALVVSLPFSLFHFRNRLFDDLFDIRMEGFVASVFPDFPFLYNVPGYGYTLESSKIGDRPALTSRPVFEVTAPAGSTVYVRTGVYDTYTGEGWELSRAARRISVGAVSRFESTSSGSSFVPTEPITFKILIDFYSSLPHTLGTVAFRFPGEKVPQTGLAGLGAGFVLDAPLRRGSEIVDLAARPGDTTPRPVVVGYRGAIFSGNAALPPWDRGGFSDGARRRFFAGGRDDAGYDRGSAQAPPAAGNKVALPGLLSSVGDTNEQGAVGARTAAVESGSPAPPAAARKAPDSLSSPTPDGARGTYDGRGAARAYRANDGDSDDIASALPVARGEGAPPVPYLRADGRVEYPGYPRDGASRFRRLGLPSPAYGIQYERYVLTAQERAADLQTGDVSEPLIELAHRLGASKNQATTVHAIRTYLVDNYKYSLITSTSGPYKDAVSNFLFNSKEGFCVQFASAFVILARLNGIPARYVTGFLANLPSGSDHMTVTGLSAHSWAEIWNDRLGWVTEEATPPMLAAESGDPNILQQYNPTDSSFTQRQLVALLGGRLNRTSSSSTTTGEPANLSSDLSRVASSSLAGLPYGAAAGVVLVALLLLLLRFCYFRLAPVEVRFRRVVRQIARRSKARGLPDPAQGGWRAWSRGIVERQPARTPVALRAAGIIHRSVFAGNTNGYRLLRRDVVFLHGLYRRVLRRRKSDARARRREAPVP